MGRFSSPMPARLRRTASATARTASSWPTTRLCSSSSRWSNLVRSLSSMRVTGTPVQRLTTSAISSTSTSSLISLLFFCTSTSSALGLLQGLLGLLDPAVADLGHRAKSPSRSACAASNFSFSIVSLAVLIFSTRPRSPSQRALIPSRCPLSSASSLFKAFSLAVSFSRLIASRSISSCMMRRSTSSSSSGLELISMRNLLAASSMRSMALSGRKRSVM